MPAMDLDAAAAIACDPDLPVRQRVQALIDIVETVSVRDATIPDRVGDAIDDLALVDAAVAMKHASAVCAALHQLGPRPDLVTTRKRVVRRLIAAGVGGLALAGLAIDIGDVQPGAALAARDFDEHIAPRLVFAPSDAIVEAFLGWLAEKPDVALAAVLRQLASRVAFEELFAFTKNPTRSERLRRMARSILAS